MGQPHASSFAHPHSRSCVSEQLVPHASVPYTGGPTSSPTVKAWPYSSWCLAIAKYGAPSAAACPAMVAKLTAALLP